VRPGIRAHILLSARRTPLSSTVRPCNEPNMLQQIRGWAATKIRQIERRLVHQERTVCGIIVNVRATPAYDFDTVFAGVEDALAIIAEHHPVWIRRIQRDVAKIYVYRRPSGRGAFVPDLRGIVLDSYFVSTFTPAEVGSCIVHEATHARIEALDKGASYSECRARHERICRRAEIRFGQRLSEPERLPVIERARAALEGTDEEVAPVPDPLESWRITQLGLINDLGLPRWLESWLVSIRKQRKTG
jgi:hypothetical protein